MGGGEVELVSLTKRFSEIVAVDNIDLRIGRGEFFSLLGPSGCGKTTTLRLIAGFERPTSGHILIDGVDVARMPPHQRDVNTVFQSYALFPFLSVFDNVAFGLKYRRVPKSERGRLVREALELVQLPKHEKRRPSQLSGGQQQRVALARALILHPAVLLLDEPLGALDAKLRRALQIELKSLQESVGITFLYVTHDQEEALTMSDRLAVMDGGHIVQVGTPTDVYEEPANAYVADFLGVSNLMEAQAIRGGDDRRCQLKVGEFDLEAACGATTSIGPVRLAIRPERIKIEPFDATGPNLVPGMVERLVFLGSATQVIVRAAPGARLQALVQNDGAELPYAQGTPVKLHLPADSLRVLAETSPTGRTEEAVTPNGADRSSVSFAAKMP